MEQYIAELEEDRVAELEAYLVSTGLDDYELTEEALTVRGRVSPSLAESAAYLLPVISEKAVITAARGTIDENAPVGFNLNPGFRFTEYRIKPDRTGCFEVRIEPRRK